MNTTIKAAWLAALRSGTIQQTRETLQDQHGMCCLGVLCMVLPAMPGLWIAHRDEDAFEAHVCESPKSELMVICDAGEEDETWSDVELPEPLLRRLHLQGAQHELICMNDGAGPWTNNPQPFSAIADWIEQNIEADAAEPQKESV